MEKKYKNLDKVNPMHFKKKKDFFFQNADAIIESCSKIDDTAFLYALKNLTKEPPKRRKSVRPVTAISNKLKPKREAIYSAATTKGMTGFEFSANNTDSSFFPSNAKVTALTKSEESSLIEPSEEEYEPPMFIKHMQMCQEALEKKGNRFSEESQLKLENLDAASKTYIAESKNLLYSMKQHTDTDNLIRAKKYKRKYKPPDSVPFKEYCERQIAKWGVVDKSDFVKPIYKRVGNIKFLRVPEAIKLSKNQRDELKENRLKEKFENEIESLPPRQRKKAAKLAKPKQINRKVENSDYFQATVKQCNRAVTALRRNKNEIKQTRRYLNKNSKYFDVKSAYSVIKHF